MAKCQTSFCDCAAQPNCLTTSELICKPRKSNNSSQRYLVRYRESPDKKSKKESDTAVKKMKDMLTGKKAAVHILSQIKINCDKSDRPVYYIPTGVIGSESNIVYSAVKPKVLSLKEFSKHRAKKDKKRSIEAFKKTRDNGPMYQQVGWDADGKPIYRRIMELTTLEESGTCLHSCSCSDASSSTGSDTSCWTNHLSCAQFPSEQPQQHWQPTDQSCHTSCACIPEVHPRFHSEIQPSWNAWN